LVVAEKTSRQFDSTIHVERHSQQASRYIGIAVGIGSCMVVVVVVVAAVVAAVVVVVEVVCTSVA